MSSEKQRRERAELDAQIAAEEGDLFGDLEVPALEDSPGAKLKKTLSRRKSPLLFWYLLYLDEMPEIGPETEFFVKVGDERKPITITPDNMVAGKDGELFKSISAAAQSYGLQATGTTDGWDKLRLAGKWDVVSTGRTLNAVYEAWAKKVQEDFDLDLLYNEQHLYDELVRKGLHDVAQRSLTPKRYSELSGTPMPKKEPRKRTTNPKRRNSS